MTHSIKPSKTSGKINVLASKSVAHRALIMAFLSGKKCFLRGNFQVEDIYVTINALRQMGAVITEVDGGLEVCQNGFVSGGIINLKDCGSSLRFLLPLVCALGISCTFTGSERLSNRPISELLQVLTQHGARFSANALPFSTSGKLCAGEYKINASVSSQYVSGLMMALPVLDKKSKITLVGNVVSGAYINVTQTVMSDFGVVLEKTANGFEVSPQIPCAVQDYCVEGDWSSACFPLALGALCGNASVCGLNMSSGQADKVVLDLLKKIGAKISVDGGVVTSEKVQLNAIEFNAENCPDVVPCISAVLASASGVSKIYNVSRLKDKESDRLLETTLMLKAFGIKAEVCNNALIIYGGAPRGAIYRSPNDHRMAMSACVLACSASGNSTIDGLECVAKSYPRFLEDIISLGVKVDV